MSDQIKLLVGLANPGLEYKRTRHNAGAWVVEELARVHNVTLREETKFFGLTGRIQANGQDLRLLIPTTFMNLSGKAISISKTTAPHAVSYPFTAHFGISHGNAVSLTLNEFLIFNYKNLKKSDVKFNLKKRFEILFKLSKTKSINEMVNFIEEIKRKAKTEASFKKIKLPSRVMIPKILSGINIDRLSNNPVKLSIEDVRKIIESKFALRK